MPMTSNATKKAQAAVSDLQKKWQSAADNDLFPKGVGSKADYDKLEAAVKESTVRNENQAATASRIKALGQSVVSLAKFLSVV